MVVKRIIIFLTLALFLSSCATPALWKKTDPDRYIYVKMLDITEKELIDKKVKYYKNESVGLYYVEKNDFEKKLSLTLRYVLLPVAVTADVGIAAIVVVGVAVVIYYCPGCVGGIAAGLGREMQKDAD